MTTKKYLTTPEEVLALKDTDAKIYIEDSLNYYRFIDGCLCWFNAKGDFDLNVTMHFSGDFQAKYIVVEEPVKEADKNDIGKLCRFWNDNPQDYVVSILCEVYERGDYPYGIDCCDCYYKYCRRLTPAEVAEITGYKVEA